MMGRYDHLIGQELAHGTWSWNTNDPQLYALAVGAGIECAADELQFTTDNTEGLPQQVIPSFLTLASTGERWMKPLGFRERAWDSSNGEWPDGLVHGEQGITLARPLPTSGRASVSVVLVGVYDKVSGALVIADTLVHLADTGELLGVARAGMFVRGQGGWGGPPQPASAASQPPPDREPDMTVVHRTCAGQSLIYRQLGDRNPHCTDPARARADGFERPIFHGLGTFGFACRALTERLCGGDVGKFRSMSARFAKPVFPGEVLTTRIWLVDDAGRFETLAGDGRLVLDRGSFAVAE